MGVDYKEVLTDLRRRRADIQRRHEQEIHKLDQAIAAIEEMIPKQPSLAFVAGRTESENENRTLPYADKKSIHDAALECLRHHGRPMKTKDLANELLAGGFPTESKNFATTVYGALARYKSELSVSNGVWALAEWDHKQSGSRENG